MVGQVAIQRELLSLIRHFGKTTQSIIEGYKKNSCSDNQTKATPDSSKQNFLQILKILFLYQTQIL